MCSLIKIECGIMDLWSLCSCQQKLHDITWGESCQYGYAIVVLTRQTTKSRKSYKLYYHYCSQRAMNANSFFLPFTFF